MHEIVKEATGVDIVPMTGVEVETERDSSGLELPRFLLSDRLDLNPCTMLAHDLKQLHSHRPRLSWYPVSSEACVVVHT